MSEVIITQVNKTNEKIFALDAAGNEFILDKPLADASLLSSVTVDRHSRIDSETTLPFATPLESKNASLNAKFEFGVIKYLPRLSDSKTGRIMTMNGPRIIPISALFSNDIIELKPYTVVKFKAITFNQQDNGSFTYAIDIKPTQGKLLKGLIEVELGCVFKLFFVRKKRKVVSIMTEINANSVDCSNK